ncbi:YncE family protein [Streptomyces massasporeus]
MTPWALCVAPDGRHVYVSSLQGGRVLPGGIALDPVRKRLCASTSVGSFISVIDTDSDTEIRRIATNGHPFALAVSPDGTRLYVTDSDAATVTVVGTGTSTVIRTSPASASPRSARSSPRAAPGCSWPTQARTNCSSSTPQRSR